MLTGYVTQKAKLFESGEIDENQERDRRKMQEDLTALKEKYCYLYETHMHTKEGSACGRDNAADIVRAYKEAGYAGVIVTDHFYGGNTAIDRSLPWEEWVEAYCKGYEHALEEGNKIGIQVFFGWEQTYDGTDFLIYGLDKEWLKKHPELRTISIEEQYELVHNAGGMVIHAHPYRVAPYIKEIRLKPESVDGVEVINAAHGTFGGKPYEKNKIDDQAMEYALKYDFPKTAGSDMHSVHLVGGGMAFSRKLENVQDYMKAIMAREGLLLPTYEHV